MPKRDILALRVALEERDMDTSEHSDRVAGLSMELGRRCALSEQELNLLWIAATAHDMGKIGIPDTVLKKTTALDDDDWAVMRAHSEKSQRIVLAANLPDAAMLGRIVRHHHERHDGKGYPDGIAGEAVPILSRIVAVADSYDAMARLRVYSRAKTHREIMDEFQRERGSQFDPYLVDKLAAFIENSPFQA